MIVVNFAHPFTQEQYSQIVALLGERPRLYSVETQADRQEPLAHAAKALVDAVGLGPSAWQTEPIVINPPGLAGLATAIMAEIHGRSGYFLPILNIRPIAGSTPTRYEVAEIVNLDAIRQEARTRRLPRVI